MPKISKTDVQDWGLDLNWFLNLLCQLPPIEIEIPGSGPDDTFYLIIALNRAK